MALTSEQWKSLEDMAQQIGRETIANGLGSPQAQGTGSPAYSENASPRERYNQLWEIRKQQAAEAAASAEQRAERRERVRSNFLATMNQVQEKQSRTNEASATPVPGSVQAQNLVSALEQNLREKSQYERTSAKENPDAAKNREEATKAQSELDKANEQMAKMQQDIKAAERAQNDRRAAARQAQIARTADDAFERGVSYTDQYESYSKSLSELNKQREQLTQQLKDIRGGRAGYFGQESAEAQEKAEKETVDRLEKLEREIERIEGTRNYAGSRIGNDKATAAIIRQGEELSRNLRETWDNNNQIMASTMSEGRAAKFMDKATRYAPNQNWTPEQMTLYNYLLAAPNHGPEDARNYAAQINDALNRGTLNAELQHYENAGALEDRSGIVKAIGTAALLPAQVAALPSHALSYMEKLSDVLQGNPYVTNAVPTTANKIEAMSRGRARQLNVGTTLPDGIPIVGGKGAGDLFQLGQSAAESLVLGNLVGEAATLGSFFVQAADTTFDEAKSRGASDQYAAVMSILAGAAETAGEKIGLDHLLNGEKALAKGLGRYLLEQGLIEGSEEGVTDVLNQFGDRLASRITGNETKMQHDIRALVSQGMGYEDAERKVWKDFVDETLYDMFGGFISGAMSAGVQGPASIGNQIENKLWDMRKQRAAEANAVRQNAAPPAQPAAAQEPTTRNPLYEAIRPRAEPVAESATTPQTPQNATQTQEAPTGEITPPTAQNAQSEAGAQPQTAETAQARLERAQARYDEIDRLFSSNEVSDEDAPRLVAEMEERYNEIQELTPIAERERQSAADAQTQQQRVEAGEVSNGYGTAENHIDRRTPESVAKTGMKSFQFDHPQLHDYYVEAAQALMDEVQAAEAVDYERKVNKNTQRKTGSAIKGPVRRLMDLGLTKPQILKCLEDIISDNGQENYAAAKKVELVLNDMLTNGWTSTRGRTNYHEPNAAYISAKDAIGGGIKADSWEKYLAQNELSLIDGTVTEDQLRQEWEQMHPQEEAATAAEQEPAPEASQPVETASTETEQGAGTIPASEQTTAERANGQDERGYTGPLVDTQDRVFETQLTDAEKQIPGLTAEEARHIQHHDAEVDIRAKERIAAGVNQARADLLAAESWSDEDTATAGYIIQAELEAAEKAGSVEERAAIYKRLAELKKQWNKQGTEQGRALRQRQRFVAEDMVSAAADILYSDKSGKNEKALRKLNPQAKDAIMGKVREYAKRFNDMQKNGGTVGDLVQLIKDVSVQRRTTGLFSRENGRAVDFALSEVAKQDGGVDFLKELATTQIKSIASDYLKPGIIDQIKSWRFMAMLSNAATTTANAGSNFVFGSFMEALSGNLALPFDMLMSQVTGQREVAGELGAFSKTKWQGSYDAMLRSFLEVTLDAETAQADYGYKELKGGTFKMVGNPLERLLATMQKYQGYALKTTDQAAKGGTEAQVRKGLGKLAERGKAKAENIDALAEQEAKYRTLQTEGRVSKAVNTVRGAFDDAVHIGNERTGKYGIASDIMPFAQVPANAVAVTLESNPAIGAAKAIVETAKVLADGKNVEPGQQAKAARAWGRVANGVAVAATFAALAAKGYLRDYDDENKDIAAQRKAEGRSGVQLNISALLRGDPSEREDDLWVDFSWIPPLNGLANFGVDMYRAYTEDGHIDLKDVSLASGDALASAFMDFPAVSKISSMIQTYQYSEADGILGKLLETGVTGAAQTASSILVPNAVRAAAAGLDPYERDVYNTDTYGEGIVNNLISGIPGLRETLPERLDTFGQPVKNEGGALHFLDKTVIPGEVNRHERQSEASKYVEALISKTGDKKLQPSRYPPYKATLGDGDDKQSVELTAAERREYQQTRGNAIAEMTQELAESRAMRGATDGQKALFSAIKNAANHAAEAELAKSRGIEQTPTQIDGKNFMSFAEMGAPETVLDRLAENGMTGKGRNTLWEIMRGSGESARAFADAEAQIVGESGTASQARVFEALRGKDYTAEEKQQIWEAYSPSGKTAWKTSYADYAAKNGGDESKATKSSGNTLYDYYAERMKNAK